MYYHNGQEARKVIQATDNRNNDFKMANQAMGLLETPDGYVWHHLDDYNVEKNTITMELVMDEAHNASKPHSGGCAQYDSVNEPTYNKKRRQMYGFVKEKSENTHISSCEVLEIENKYNINFPTMLKEYYLSLIHI